MTTKSTSPGHVGMLVHSYYPGDQRIRREAEALAEAGYRVDVICLRSYGTGPGGGEAKWEKLNGVYVHRLPLEKKRGTALRYLYEYALIIGLGLWKLTALNLASRFQVVHIHNMPDFLIMAGLPFKWLGANLILDIHDPMPEIYLSMNPSLAHSWVHRMLAAQQCWSCRRASRIIAANQVLAENLVDKCVPAGRVYTINNFPDPKHFPVKSDLLPWPKHKDHLTLIYAGTITALYHVEDVIRAISLLKEVIRGIRLILVGSGEDVAKVLRLAARLGIEDRVFHRRRVYQKILRSILETADIGISTHIGGPSEDLVFAQKILDYLSQGLPVVANRSRAHLRYIPEEAVYYYQSGNPQEMADQISRICHDSVLLGQKREYGLRLASSFSWEGEKKNLQLFYRRLIALTARADNRGVV